MSTNTKRNRTENDDVFSAVVLGATGLVGSHLIDQLVKNDGCDSIRSVTRRPESYASRKVVNEVVDFECLHDHRSVFLGDVLFSCLGTTKNQAGSIAEQRKVDLDYQYQAAKLAAENEMRQCVLVSSSGANSKSFSPYLKMKGELEDALTLLGFESLSIVQPSLLLGNRPKAQPKRLAEELGGQLLPWLCKLPALKRYRPIPAELVATRMIELAIQRKPGVETVILDQVFPTPL